MENGAKRIDAATRFTQSAVALSLKLHRIGMRQSLEDDEFEASGASKEMVSASKRLFADCEELDAIRSHMSKTKKWVEARSLPSGFRGGIWFVKTTAVEELDTYLDERAKEMDPLVQAFVDVLDQRISEAKAKLGKLGDNAKWPTAKKVRARFAINWQWMVFETPESLKGLSKSLYKREREKAAGAIAEARESAISLLREEVKNLVDHMVERLTPGDDGKAKTFKAGTVEGLSEFLKNFDIRNLAEDGELEAVVKKASRLLDGVDANLIRSEEGVRNAVAKGFGDLQSKIDALVVERPKRQIDFEE
jgi:hypothetical protein